MKATISPDRRTLTIEVDALERRKLVKMGELIHQDGVMYDFLETLVANGELEWINPEETGDLTSAPMLGIRNPNADHPSESGQVTERWAWTDYATTSLLEALRDNRCAVLTS